MNELIKVSEVNGKQAVSARELYKVLEATERFSNWIERQFQYGFIENVDYFGCTEFNTLANQWLTDYILTMECAKEISMLQKSDIGKQIRVYLIKLENEIKDLKIGTFPVFNIPKTFSEALQLAANQAKQIELQQSQIKELEPKAEIFEHISNAENLLTLNDAAKSLGIGRNTLMQNLRNQSVLRANNTPYQKYIDSGYFEVKVKPIKIGDSDTNYIQTFVTGKGLTWLATASKSIK